MKVILFRIILTAVLLPAAYLIERNMGFWQWQLLLVYGVPYLVVGYDVLAQAVEGVTRGDPFDEHFLMAVATIGALMIGFLPGAESECVEAVLVLLFFQVGELFEQFAKHRSRKAVSDLMDLRPDVAHVLQGDVVREVSPEALQVGDVIEIRPGEKVPVDGEVLSGNSSLDTVALTGESMPRGVSPSDSVLSGSVNLSGVLRVRVLKSFGDSTATKILDLVEHAGENKSRGETFITRFARVYTPIVVLAALAVAFIPPFFADSYIDSFSVWLYRDLTLLVISCPCALVISVPLTFFAGIGGASRKGILIKGGRYMDMLAKIDTVVFDKTGTLTRGRFEVTGVSAQGPDVDEMALLRLAALAERYSSHPIAQSLRDACAPASAVTDCSAWDVEEVAGQGVRAKVGGDIVCVGNEKMMESAGGQRIANPAGHLGVGTIIHVAVNGEYAGHVVIADSPKPDAKETIEGLRGLGVRNLVMLTGDIDAVGREASDQLGLDAYYAGLLPADKVTHVERLSREKPKGSYLAFVGDGINDAPVLARADIGIAMGALGSDAAIEASDIVLMDDKLSRIKDAIMIAQHTLGIAWQNTWFSIFVKVAVLVLAACGVAGMGFAVFADVGVMVLAVVNAMRALDT